MIPEGQLTMDEHPGQPANRLPRYPGCCMCGTGERSGTSVTFYVVGDTVRVDFTPTETHRGFPGIIHGGILSALLDETMGWAPTLKVGRFCVTGEMAIRFLRSVPIGQPVTVVARAGRLGRVCTASAEVIDSDGAVYARAEGKYVPLSIEGCREVARALVAGPGTIPLAEWLDEEAWP